MLRGRRSRRDEHAGIDFIAADGDAGDAGDTPMHRSSARRAGWLIGAAAVLLVVGFAVGRGISNRSDPSPPAVTDPSPTGQHSATPTPMNFAGSGYTVGDRCPTGITCGVADRVVFGMERTFNAEFRTAVVINRVSAFDAATGRLYWQQLAGRLPGGGQVTATEQRTSARELSSVHTDYSPDGGLVTVYARRSSWRFTVTFIEQAVSPGDVRAAIRWVKSAPPPR